MNRPNPAPRRSEIEHWLDEFLRNPGFLEAYPYYVAILGKLTPVADPSVRRMAVSLHDGRFFLHVNVEAFLTEPQFLRGVLLHEVHHLVLGHLTNPRFAAVEEPELMDLAVEMSANEYISEPLPPAITCAAYSAFGIRPGQSTWERYEILARWWRDTGRRPRPAPGAGEDGPVDDHRFLGRGKTSPGGVAQTGLLVERAIGEARAARRPKRPPEEVPPAPPSRRRSRRKSPPAPAAPDEASDGRQEESDDGSARYLVAGRSPARLVEDLFETTRAPEEIMDWRAALALFVARARAPLHTWSRPSRRFPERIFEIPGRTWAPRRMESPRLLVAIDTSLSMTRLELEEIARQLVQLGEGAHVTVAECDAAVSRVYPFGGRIDSVIGRGGTDLRPVFAPSFLGAHDIDGVVYFTDGEGPFPPEPPPVPTLWVLTKPLLFRCPWGERARLRSARTAGR